MEWKRSKQKFISRMPLFYCISICFFSLCALVSTIGARTVNLDIRSPCGKSDCYFQLQDFQKTGEKRKNIEGISISRSKSWVSRSLTRRNLSGAGSWPPRCTSKCGKCKPCKPVRVTIPPGRPVTTEYYPEAWRCKCGNKLYLP